MLKKDFNLREMLDIISLMEKNTDSYLFVYDLSNDEVVYSKTITSVFALKDYRFGNATEVLKDVVHPDDFEMLMRDINDGVAGRNNEHNLEYRWKTVDGTYAAISCRGQYVESYGIIYLIGRISEIGKQSRFDNKTGLYREVVLEKFFNDNMSVAGKRGFLMLLGIDSFKDLNERFGSDIGDKVLLITVNAIRKHTDSSVHVYRMPGDEYAIFVMGTDGDEAESAKNLYKNIRRQIDEEIESIRYDIFFTVSAGAAVYETDGKMKYKDLIKNAKFALHQSKLKGKNRFELFNEEQYEGYVKALGIQDELRRCVNNSYEGFELYYQPIYEANKERLIGAEALIRWKTEKYGFMGPDKFIPLLEETALIIPLGKWIIDTAAKTCNKWIANIPDFVMHINLSYVQIVKSDIMHDVLEYINRYSSANSHYVFELTESRHLEGSHAIKRVLKNFSENHFQLAIDDFGTGYSNFGYLKEKSFDIVKVDKSFVTDIDKTRNNYLMVGFIIKLAHEMGIRVCVEGVEREEELNCVRHLGADCIQGYYYGKPVPMTDFEEQHIKKLFV